MFIDIGFALLLALDPCRDGMSALERRDLPAAESLLKQCTSLQGYVALAGIYQSQQNADALYKVATAALKKFHAEKRFYLTAGTYEARQKQYEAAVRTFHEGARRWPDDPQLGRLLASSYFALGTQQLDAAQNEAAVKSLSQAAKLAPEDIEAHLNLGRALHNTLRHSEALKAFDRVLELNPSLPLARFHRGMALYTLGAFDKAIVDLSVEIGSNPTYPPARLLRGLAYLANADWNRAEEDLRIAATAMPGNANAQYGYGRALIQKNDLAAAEEALRRAMAADPSDPAPANTLVSLLHRLERSEEARSLSRKAAELSRAKRTAARGEIRFESVTAK